MFVDKLPQRSRAATVAVEKQRVEGWLQGDKKIGNSKVTNER